MIDRALAKKQIGKLQGQPFAGQLDKEGWGVLMDSLVRWAETPEHADEIITACLALKDRDDAPRMATVLDISNIAYQTRKTEVRPWRDCEDCGGSGWRTVVRGDLTGAERCNCWKRQRVEDAPIYCGKTASAGEAPEEIQRLAGTKGIR